MLLDYALTASYGAVLGKVHDAAERRVRSLVASVADQPQPVMQAALMDLAPEAFGPAGDVASAAAATFYEEMRDVQGFRGSFSAETLPLDPAVLYPIIGAGTAPAMFEQGTAAMIGYMAGWLVSALSEHASDTIIGNAAMDSRNRVLYQRVPSAGCCAFCAMLASRSAGYSSKAAAETVVGCGMPVGSTKGKRGGQARGIRPRGTRALGEKFHDHCRCRGVPVLDGNSVQLQAKADQYYNAYATARDKVSAGQKWIPAERDADGNRTTKGHWVDAAGNARSNDEKISQILAFMRADLGVK